MKIQIIGNPIAGGGKASRKIADLAAILEARGHDVHRRLTEKGGDAGRFAADLQPGDCDRLAIVGGDGTVHEVLNGIVDPSTMPPMAVLSSGTANLLARELRLPRDAQGIADVIESGTVRHLDWGRINNDRRFLLVVSAGMDAMVIEEIHRSRRGKLGFRGYPLPILRVLRRYTPPKLSITIDAAAPMPASLVVVSNTRIYAGLLSVTDRAVCDSGHLDLCVFPPRAGIAKLLSYGLSAFRRRISRRHDVAYKTAHRVRIASDGEPVPVEVDGEYFGTTPVEIEVEPGAVPFLVPPQ